MTGWSFRTRHLCHDACTMLLLVGLATSAAAAASGIAGDGATGWMVGVNLSGGELNPGKARLGTDYIYPTTAELDYFASKGLRTFRVPVLSERLVEAPHRATGAMAKDWEQLTALIAHAAILHGTVIVDLHQYGSMPSGLVGRDDAATADFAAAWGALAARLSDRPNVIFGLMNEPHAVTAAEWLVGANAAIAAIRKARARQLVLVPGSYWDGADSWTKTDNAGVMAGVVDPLSNFAYEVHQYLDSDGSGTNPHVVSGAGATRLAAFTDWARQHHAHGFLGEFGFASDAAAVKEGGDLIAYTALHRDVWLGWTYWAAGPWWGDYMFSVEPSSTGDKAQLKVLMHVQ